MLTAAPTWERRRQMLREVLFELTCATCGSMGAAAELSLGSQPAAAARQALLEVEAQMDLLHAQQVAPPTTATHARWRRLRQTELSRLQSHLRDTMAAEPSNGRGNEAKARDAARLFVGLSRRAAWRHYKLLFAALVGADRRSWLSSGGW